LSRLALCQHIGWLFAGAPMALTLRAGGSVLPCFALIKQYVFVGKTSIPKLSYCIDDIAEKIWMIYLGHSSNKGINCSPVEMPWEEGSPSL